MALNQIASVSPNAASDLGDSSHRLQGAPLALPSDDDDDDSQMTGRIEQFQAASEQDKLWRQKMATENGKPMPCEPNSRGLHPFWKARFCEKEDIRILSAQALEADTEKCILGWSTSGVQG